MMTVEEAVKELQGICDRLKLTEQDALVVLLSEYRAKEFIYEVQVERNKKLEETLRAAYIALKKHENLDVDIVGEAMGILEERAWSNE